MASNTYLKIEDRDFLNSHVDYVFFRNLEAENVERGGCFHQNLITMEIKY